MSQTIAESIFEEGYDQGRTPTVAKYCFDLGENTLANLMPSPFKLSRQSPILIVWDE